VEALETKREDSDDNLVAMYHRKLPDDHRLATAVEFSKKKSNIRCLVCTIAFGLGVEVSDLPYVIHWGPSKSLLDYWQEVGRAARDIELGTAILYKPAYSIRHTDSKFKELIGSMSKICIRKQILREMKVDGMKEDDIEKCCGGEKCCSACNRN